MSPRRRISPSGTPYTCSIPSVAQLTDAPPASSNVISQT